MNHPATFLGPVNQLPAEGSNFAPSGTSEVEICASLFANSALWFDVSVNGVVLVSNPHETELFQLFTLEVSENDPGIFPTWSDRAFEISLQGLFPDAGAFETMSDASEPEDFVRRFLEVFSSSLKHSDLEAKSSTLPLIRWQAGR